MSYKESQPNEEEQETQGVIDLGRMRDSGRVTNQGGVRVCCGGGGGSIWWVVVG